MVAKTSPEFERALHIYTQQIKNLDHPDDVATDALLVLSTRESFLDDYPLTPEQQRQLDQADNELVRRWKVLREALPAPHNPSDRRRWWWFLHEGPQVRENGKEMVSVRGTNVA